jgi:hypothetical protein
VYGGYQQNEFHHWFGEFQINFSNDPRAFVSIFNDTRVPVEIAIDVEIHADERDYLKKNADSLITAQAWRAVVPELYAWRSLNAAPFTAQFRSREGEVKERAAKDMEIFHREIDLSFITARIFIPPNAQPQFTPSKILELVFSTFDLSHFGIIDYHGPHRMYGREVLNTINVNLDAIEEQRKQSTLYNYNNKYQNIKSEMAGLYVREALAAKAGTPLSQKNSITDTLKELFTTFFPEKEFLGPQPTADGSLRFPVKVGGRETHDLDELSSGEKEILYGYLRLRSSAPKNSVILLDEPELHLNPRLTKNLPDFYYKHLAKALGNQVWLITHSDAILRESVGKAGVSVFHMTPSAYAANAETQARLIQADEHLERAIIDLVGDLAAYNPGGRVVIFEGEESDFDLRMTSDLFPELPGKANLISGTNKRRVRGLHALLEKITAAGRLPAARIFSITDRDFDPSEAVASENRFSWNCYHIENYLLEPRYLLLALRDLSGRPEALSEAQIEVELHECAAETMASLILHNASQFANGKIIAAIKARTESNPSDISQSLSNALESSQLRVAKLLSDELSAVSIKNIVNTETLRLSADLESGAWRESFRGRDVLRRFVGRRGEGLKYEQFRNLVIARMRDDGFQPAGMKAVLDQIMAPQPLTR